MSSGSNGGGLLGRFARGIRSALTASEPKQATAPQPAAVRNTPVPASSQSAGDQTAEVDNSQPVASVNPAIAMIDEGNALEEQGRIPEAMARYEAAIQTDPRCARAHLNRGNILLAGAKFDEARSAYQLAIACDPHYAAAHFNLGNLNSGAGEFELALRNYQEAIGIRPDFADAFVAMANALDSLGRTAEAVESYQRALAIIPGYAEVHFNLGMLAMRQGRHDEAVKSLRRAVEIKPDFAQAHRHPGHRVEQTRGARCGGGKLSPRFGHRARIRGDSLRTGDDSSGAGQGPGGIAAADARARASADVGDQSSLCHLRRAHGIFGQRLTGPRSTQNRHRRTMGTTVPVLPLGTQSHHARPEDC